MRAVARGATKAAELRDAGAEPTAVDLFDADAVKAATAGVDAILHLATHIPRCRDMRRPGAWTMNNRLRTEGDPQPARCRAHARRRHVRQGVDHLRLPGPRRSVDRRDRPARRVRASRCARRSRASGCVDGFVAGGGRGVVLRFGSFYGVDAHRARRLSATRAMAASRRSPEAPGAYTSSIHVDDAATAVVAALDVAGRRSTTSSTTSRSRGARSPTRSRRRSGSDSGSIPCPRGWCELHPGRRPIVPRSASQRVSNRKFRDATGWAPTYPSVREGWAAVAAAARRRATRA